MKQEQKQRFFNMSKNVRISTLLYTISNIFFISGVKIITIFDSTKKIEKKMA
jgi:hypothetical protein